MRYIDFDGVILDTEDILFYDWRNEPERFNMPWDTLDRYIERAMWKKILEQAPVINDAIYILKNIDCNDTSIITKVHSLDNEGAAKINYLRGCGVKQNIVLVPYNMSICDVVSAKDNSNLDSNGEYNSKKYQRVLRIDAKREK